jgi:hypothetical protein
MPRDLQIETLALSLPPGWEGRATLFARRLARLLGELELPEAVSRDRLVVPPLTLRPGESDQAVARRVARAVATALHAPTGSAPTLPARPSAAPNPPASLSPSPSRHA